MLAVQAVLDVSEESMAYSLVIDSVCAVMYVMFLLWVINFSKEFNAWTKADVRLINEVGASLEEEAKANTKPLTWKSMLLFSWCIFLHFCYFQGCRKYGCKCTACF